MNIVKGVADLIRRTSSLSSGESSSGSSALRFPPPSPKICFSEVGDEEILRMLWDKYEKTIDKVEKKKLLIVFLEQFLAIFKHWEPSDSTGHSIEAAASTVPPPEYPLRFDDVIVGCSSGHPAEVILTLTEEVPKLTLLVADFDNSGVHSKVNLSSTSRQSSINSDGLLVLEALAVINRSMHNCRVFGYYGGIQKLTALMKGAIVQLKAITGALTGDESLANVTIERTCLLQKILRHDVLVMHNFIDLNSTVLDKSNSNNSSLGKLGPCTVEPGYSLPTEPRVYWHHKAVVSVMEAGGLNWLVELLRVIRRLDMKNLQIDVSLQYLTLRVILMSLLENPRGQNHFKSIGGLEVLLDGLVLSSSNSSQLKGLPHGEGDESPLLQVCQLHMLCMMVLKEAIYANLNNLQFLCENGRIQKFANSFCSLAFLLQEYQQMHILPPVAAIHTSELRKENRTHTGTSAALSADVSFFQLWSEYVVKLSRVLCSFVVAPENTRSQHVQANTGRVPLPISSAYGELSIKWFLKVLRTIFPCIKACSNHNELPDHLRVMVNALQHCALDALKNVLVSSPASLDIFREVGLWDLLFSENFFHFIPAPEQLLGEYFTLSEGLAGNISFNQLSSCADDKMNTKGVETLQTAVISFVEFAATSKGISHNQPELSALIDALEQCAYDPTNAKILAKSMVRVIQISAEKTIASLRTLDIIPRLLHVICMQAEESRRLKSSDHSPGNKVLVHQSDQRYDSPQSWLECVESCMGLFDEFVSVADDARSLILCDSASVDCLFNLFWDGSLRSRMLRHIFDLMKMLPLSTEDQKAKLHLCSKYLEMFTQIKEGEKNSAGLTIELLTGMREMLTIDRTYYQALFRDGECFLHVVSLLNGNLDELNGEKLVLNVLRTLASLLANNDESKASFKALVGKGYQTMQSLLLDFCQCNPSESLLNTLLDMLVDGTFEANANPIIKNEDVIVLYLSVLQKSSDSSRHYGLNVFLQLLRDSISNRASCVRAGIMSFLLDWFAVEDKDSVILKIAQLVQVIGGHSISGKDIRKIFALLRSEKVGARQQYCSLLLTTISAMLNEKGPMSFFDLNGNDSGIIISTPFQWPLNKGFSFSCWLRVESFPSNGTMGLFQFLTEDGKGCSAVLGKNVLTYESINLKQQSVQLSVSLVTKKWHFLCLTHSIGRTFSGGSLLRCYVDGDLVSSERCRYPKVNDSIVNCGVGRKTKFLRTEENNFLDSVEVYGFYGQIGPVYLFSDAISPEHVQGIYSLGPSYMYSFLDNEASLFHDELLRSGVLDARDGLTSKIVFGLNAQASDGKTLFNVLPVLDTTDKKLIKATVAPGTHLCSRRLLQQILYCVGGISVFFPIIAQSDRYDNEGVELSEHMLLTPITKDRVMAEVIELIASVLDDDLANQKQMHLLSGFPILGFLLQSVPPEQLNLETFSALKHLFNIAANGGLADLLVEDAASSIFLNPLIWVFTDYNVQRELYMFLIQVCDNNPMLLKSLCRLPNLLDIIRKFYWDHVTSRSNFGSKPLLHPVTKMIIGERPRKEDIQKIRLLILSLGEMSLRQNIAMMDIKSLLSFFETSQDMQCIEDVLHMVIRAISQREVLVSFLEQLNLIGGSHIFINLLQREHEPIRLLSLQFLGKLLVGLPSVKKGPRLFSFPMGKLRSISESHKKFNFRMQPIFSAVSDRLFRFPLTDNLCATLFDLLLGGASPKQVLQKHGQSDSKKLKGNDSHFVLPQILVLIFRFLSSCDDESMRIKVVSDLLHLLDSNSSNVEALMEHGWNAWLTSIKTLDILRDYRCKYVDQKGVESAERNLVRTVFVVVLGHYICSVKGGWQQFEDTVDFLLLNEEQEGSSCQCLLRDILEDLTLMLLDHSSEGNIFAAQPCRDNMLFLLQLTDEMLVSEMGHETLFPAYGNEMSLHARQSESPKDFASALREVSQGEIYAEGVRNPWCWKNLVSQTDDKGHDKWWSLYDNIWSIINAIYGKGSSKGLPKTSTNSGPSLGQRARGLVESLNVPAAEMAAVVVSGGIGNALGGKPNKTVDRAMLLRGERCPRILFRLTIFYLCKSSLERASRCVQQVISFLPSIFAVDEEQTKSKLHLFIWELLAVRSQYGALDDGARFHVISHLILETVSCGKFLLATSIASRDQFADSGSNSNDSGFIDNLIQKDRVLLAVSEEAKYVKASLVDRSKQLEEFQARIVESISMEAAVKETFEEDIQRSLEEILAWDDARRAAALLTIEEQHQNTAEKWIHIFRTLIDERGPWSASPFPDCPATYWKLDKTEDSWRRRQKLRQNYNFDDQLCHPPSTSYGSQEQLPSLERRNSLAGHIPDQMKRFLLKGIRRITDESSEDDPGSSSQKESLSTDYAESQFSEPKSISDQKNVAQDIRDSSSLLDKENSEVLRSIPCVLVTPKRKVAGNLAVMKTVLHFFGEFLVEGTGGSAVFTKFCVLKSSDGSKLDRKSKSLGWLTHTDSCADKVEGADGGLSRTQLKHVKRHRRWNIGQIKAVHWTRYLLRSTAIEILFADSVSPIFLNFASQKEAKEVGTLIVATRNEFLFPKGINKEKNGIISFIDRRLALEMAENAKESWRRREITNFEYLMILNTLSGRSYNDLTQYPVFPWVLADYSSEVLDFNKSSTFRDLTKPVGALDSKRLEVFEDRYLNFSDPDIPSFYYGSHYSSMGIVLYYLLRLEPYTSLHRSLQGGKFDHADRLFQSIEGTYKNCLSNTSDVKELIPEFFYMPEFLVNSNSYHLGVKQDGDPIDDVCLPPWAKGSPELFVSKNREALESEYVSSNLHHWIDLVFGYAQRGKPAVEAANIFYYLTYEGAIDLESMEDELQRSAIEDQIANFGQTPIQLFRKKHPRRGLPIPIAHPLHFAPASITLTSVVSTTSNPSSGVLYVQILDSTIVLVNQGQLLSVKMWLSTQLNSGGNFTFSGFQDPLFGVGSDILSPRKIGSPLAENAELGPQCFATLQTPAENFLISCGNWENSFQVSSLNDGRTVQSIRQHKDVVSCVAVTEDGSVLATGSYDTTVMVWDIFRSRASDKRARGSTAEIPRKDYVIAETPFHILCGHDDVVTCLFASMELDIVVSASKDGTCIFHTMRKGTYVRSVRHPTGCPLSKLAASRHGRVAVYADDDLSLNLYSINGKHLAACESNGRLNCIEVSKCGEFLVCAGDQGQIILRSMDTLDIVRRYNGIGRIITCLTVTPEECFLAGTKDGSLLVYSIENPQLRRSSISRNAKSKASAAG